MKKSQQQNGLKHNSYHDYRKYCSKKVKKLRGKMGFKFGRKIFTKKEYSLENITQIEQVFVPLYNSEKFWAYAMELRQVPNENKNAKNLKFSIRNKLKKSIYWSKLFSNIVEKVEFPRISLEAESIRCYLEGLLLIEYKKYDTALENLMKSKKIIIDLKEQAGIIEKAHYSERIEQIEHNIRFCKYNLRQFDSNMQNELMEMQNLIMEDSTLADKLGDLVKEVKQTESMSETYKIAFLDTEIEVQNSQVISLIQSIEMMKNSLKTKNIETESANILDMYLEIFSKYDEAMRICTKETKEKAASEAVQKIWEKINTYLTFEKNELIIARNEILLGQLRNKLIEEKG